MTAPADTDWLDADVPTGGRNPGVPLRRWVLSASLLFLNLLDVIVTKRIIRLGGVEANPIMAPMMNHPAYPIIIKTFVSLSVGILLLSSPLDSKLADRAVLVVVLAYTAVMAWNFGILYHS